MLKYVQGDLIQMAMDSEFEVIVHGCNCFHKMGAGIALAIKNKFPDAYKIDLMTPKGVRYKLGKTSSEFCPNNKTGIRVVNAYTQFYPGKEDPEELYKNIYDCFKQIIYLYQGKKIGIPRIGCGLAGGDWSHVKNIIDEAIGDIEITAVSYKK